jgi:hypothetical protein
MRMSKARFYGILTLLAIVATLAIAAGRHQAAKPPRAPHIPATYHQPVRSAKAQHGT